MTPRACRPPSRCDRRQPRHSAQPAPFGAGRLARRRGCPPRSARRAWSPRIEPPPKDAHPWLPQYQLPEHLYMIRYKCLWAMTIGGRDREFAGGRQQMAEDDEQLRVRVAWLYFME